MATRRSLVGASAGQFALEDVEIPVDIPADGMLYRVAAVAVNPADAKISDFSPAPGSIAGLDFAGEVLLIGSEVRRFKIGDRVFGATWGQNPENKATGYFSQYALATEDHSCKIPP